MDIGKTSLFDMIKKEEVAAVLLVERMLALHESLASAKKPQEKESMQRQIETCGGWGD